MNRGNVPQLRFGGFEGEWEEKKLGEVAEFKKGKGISKSDIIEDGILECIRYGELYTTYNEIISQVFSKTNLSTKGLELSQYNDVIIPASGETQLDIATASCVLKSGVALSGDLNIIRSSLNGIFLSFYLNSQKKLEIANLAQGSSVVHLYSSQVKSLKITSPALPEQQKIATFLTAVDKKIQQLSRKKEQLEQYKKGVMQQLFSGKLRFKPARPAGGDVDGKEYADWEEKKLGEVLKSISTKKYQIKTNEFKVVGKFKVIDQGQKLIAGYSDNEDNVFKDTPVIVFGDHTTILKYIDFDFVVGADGTKLLKNINNNNLKYLFYNLSYNNVSQEGYKRHFTMLSELKLQIPTIAEQKKIADFLSNIDIKIQNTNEQITQMQNFKKGLLQQIFV